jgi:rRNA maturation RNase YbeY
MPSTLKRREVSAWISEIAMLYNKRVGEITYLFCTDAKILEVNRCYLGHDYYTDIITFDYTEGDKLSGDIYISLETVKSNAVEYKTEYATELLRVIIHGILHLCGLKDATPSDQALMTAAEDAALQQFNSTQTKKI